MTAPKVSPLGPRLLRGRHVALEPLAPEHYAPLRQAAADPATFRYFATPDFDSWLAQARAATSERLAFAVRRLDDGMVVGSTSYLDISARDARVEIGSTWYSPAAQASLVNPEAKYLLLENAFAAAGYHCVILRTDARNARSRAAILKLGARQDGTLRGNLWMPPGPLREGYFRDSVFFSILAGEWGSVKAGLEKRLAAS